MGICLSRPASTGRVNAAPPTTEIFETVTEVKRVQWSVDGSPSLAPAGSQPSKERIEGFRPAKLPHQQSQLRSTRMMGASRSPSLSRHGPGVNHAHAVDQALEESMQALEEAAFYCRSSSGRSQAGKSSTGSSRSSNGRLQNIRVSAFFLDE